MSYKCMSAVKFLSGSPVPCSHCHAKLSGILDLCRHLMRDTSTSPSNSGRPSFQVWQLVGHNLMSLLLVPCSISWLTSAGVIP